MSATKVADAISMIESCPLPSALQKKLALALTEHAALFKDKRYRYTIAQGNTLNVLAEEGRATGQDDHRWFSLSPTVGGFSLKLGAGVTVRVTTSGADADAGKLLRLGVGHLGPAG